MVFSPVSTLSAAEGNLPEQNSLLPLSLESITPRDTTHIDVEFSSPVNLSTLKLKIVKQVDNSAVKILSLSGLAEDAFTTRINLETELTAGTAYTLTVISAVGEDGSVIRDGALALREFITPSPLLQYVDVLNAPSNPSAVLVQTGNANPPTSIKPVDVPAPVKVTTPVTNPTSVVTPTPVKPEATELPLTGMNPFFLLLIVVPIAYIFLKRKA